MGGGQEAQQEDPDLLREQLFIQQARARRELKRLPGLLLEAVRMVWHTNRTSTTVVVALQLVGAAVAAAQVLLASLAVSSLVESSGQVTAGLLVPIIALAVVTLLGGLASSTSGLFGRQLGIQVERRVTDDVLDVSTRVDLVDYDDPSFYDHLSRVVANVLTQPFQVVTSLASLLGGLTGAAALAVSLVVLSPLLAVIVLSAAPALWVLARRGGSAEFEFAVEQTVNMRERQYLQDLMTRRENAAEARAYATTPFLRRRFDSLYDEFERASALLVRRRYVLAFASSMASAATATAAMVALFVLINADVISLAQAASALVAIRLLSGRLSMLFGGVSALFQSSLFLDDFDDFMRRRGEKGESVGVECEHAPIAGERVAGVRLEGVRFAYPGSERAAVDDVSLDLPSGQVVALVGENGSGKSTLAKLIAGLYDPQSGVMMWTASSGEAITPSAARRDITLVLQEFQRYAFTARENIELGRPDTASDDEAVAYAARQSGASSVVAQLPDGLDTRLSRQFANGVDLSVGQWQRLALARAFYRDSSVVVLDEPAAALDPPAGKSLYDAVARLLRDRTVLLITHRMQSVRGADRILVMQDGRVVEDGDHDALILADGLYAELVRLQETGLSAAGDRP